MPSRKSPPSLGMICLNQAVDSIDILQDQIEKFPVRIIEKFYEEMKKRVDKHGKYLRDWFIHPRIRKLDDLRLFRSRNSPRRADLIVERISEVCVNLKQLSLANIPQIAEATLLDLIPNIPTIEKLNLSRTQCTDRVLVAMNQHCSQLWDLDVSYCPVTDDGIKSLVLISINIRFLNIFCTRVTQNEGGRILKTFTALLMFYHHLSNDIAKSLNDDTEISLICNLQLLPNYKISSDNDMAIAAKLFPGLRQIISYDPESGSSHLLAKFENLKNFHSYNRTWWPIVSTVGETITSMLVNVNCHLTCLVLQDVIELDVDVIAGHFQTLNLLLLQEVTIKEKPSRRPNSFPNLHVVGLNFNYSPISEQSLAFLLPHSLRSASIRKCDSLTDAMVIEIFTVGNRYKFLKSLQFGECSEITKVGLMELLKWQNNNVLQKLDVIGCPCITDREYSDIKEHIEKENLDVRIKSNWH